MSANHGYVVRGLLPPDPPQICTPSFEQAKRIIAGQFIRIAQRMLDAQNYSACQQALLAAKSALDLRCLDDVTRVRRYWRRIGTDSVSMSITEVIGDAARAG